MSDEQDDLAQQPSAKRLERAREQGQVPLGRDAPLVAALAAGAGALLILGGAFRTGLVHAVEGVAGALPSTPFRALPQLAAGPAAAAAAVCAAAAVGGTLVTLVQTKGEFWPHLPLPDFSRIFNPSRLARFLSKELLADLGVAAVKVVALAWAAWTSIRGDFMTLSGLLGAAPADQLARTFGILLRAGWRMLAVAVVLAGVDLAIVHRRYGKSMRVSKQEAKHEARDDAGDPVVKGKRRQKHRELSRGRARIEVPRADALVVNPTHVAVALRYRKDEGRAPRVTAKGKGALAEYMRELARENALPIVQDVPLARLLYRKVKVGREIPPQTYKAVAAVLAFVYRVTGRAADKGAAA